MKLKKRILRNLAVGVFIIGSTLSYAEAQAQHSEGNRAVLIEQLENDHAQLDLSEDQKQPYTDITLKYADQLKSIKQSSAGRMNKISKVKSLKKSKDEEMKGLLSKKQYETYLTIQKERWEQVKNRSNK